MATIAYVRVSTKEQSFARQLATIRNHLQGEPDRIFQDKLTGAKASRPGLNQLLEFIREGDLVIVSEADRLARSLRDLLNIVQKITEKKANLKLLDSPIDTSSENGEFMLQIMGALAEFERKMIRRRCQEGIDIRKQKGDWADKRRKIPRNKLIALLEEYEARGDKTGEQIAKEHGIHLATLYRNLRAARKLRQA